MKNINVIFKTNYRQLKKIARPHIGEGEDLPSNSFLLLNQLHIPFKSKKQCEDDYSSSMTPQSELEATIEEIQMMCRK